VTPLADRVDALLPQTQCTRCGYPACRPYAEALAEGTAALNRCPPGGAALIGRLAALLERPPLALDPACGIEAPLRIARIDPARCIGCTLCIQACPVDAIVGTARRLHAVIEADCSGCELCVPPCPVDCIAIEPAEPARAWSDDDAAAARRRYDGRRRRLARERAAGEAAVAAAARRHAVVAAAIARAAERAARQERQA